MTVAELIAKLSDYPRDMPVVVAGFDESGFSDVNTVEKVLIFDTGFIGHSGRYEEDNDVERRRSGRAGDAPGFEAVYVNF